MALNRALAIYAFSGIPYLSGIVSVTASRRIFCPAGKGLRAQCVVFLVVVSRHSDSKNAIALAKGMTLNRC